MAKQVVGPLERHVEKAVLALTGIGLIGVIAMYLVTSPNQIDLDGEMVTPHTLEGKLARKAADAQQQIGRGRVDEQEFEPLAAQFVEALDPFGGGNLSVELASGVMFGPEVPIVDLGGVPVGESELVEGVRLGKSEVESGRSVYVLGEEGSVSEVAANWVTVSVLFNREEQAKLQAREYGNLRKNVIFGPVELQRRVERADGTWSDDDWELVEAWPKARPPEPPEIPFVEEDGVLIVPEDDRDNVERFRDTLGEPRMQLGLVRPLMVDIVVGKPWALPALVPYPELLRMDDDFLHPDSIEPLPEVDLEDRYLQRRVEETVTETVELTPTQERAAQFKEGERILAGAYVSRSEMEATLAFNTFIEIFQDREASRSEKARAQRKAEEAEQLIRDIDRDKRRRDKDHTRPGPGDGAEEKERELQPRQQLWAHDAQPGSVKSGDTYQYRIRATLYNRLAGEPSRFKDPENARVLFIPGKWSEPSDPVFIEPVNQVFATGADARKKTVKLELYQWFDGVWVTSRANFGVGDRVKLVKREPVPARDNPEEADYPEVTFEANANVVSIEFERPFRERKGRGDEVRFQETLTTDYSVVLVNAGGELEERFIPRDKGHPEKRTLAAQVYREPKDK